MNKENAIAKINKYGKIGRILTNIAMVLTGIATVTTLIASISLFFVPEDVMKLNIGNGAELIVNPKAITPDIPESEIEQIVAAFNNNSLEAGLNLGTVSYKFHGAQLIDGKIVATANNNTNTISFSKLGATVILAAIAAALSFISLFFANKLCKAFEKCESPFANEVITTMRNFAFSLIPWAIFSSVPQFALNKIFGNNLNTGASLDTNVIFTVLIILALTIVFKYGAILQQESDETL